MKGGKRKGQCVQRPQESPSWSTSQICRIGLRGRWWYANTEAYSKAKANTEAHSTANTNAHTKANTKAHTAPGARLPG